MPVGIPELKIDFGGNNNEQNVAPEETPKAMGGTELVQKWLFSKPVSYTHLTLPTKA